MDKLRNKDRFWWRELKCLWNQFDPIGVLHAYPDWPDDEYDSYVDPTFKLLEKGADFNELNDYISFIVRDYMGMDSSSDSYIEEFVRKLQAWYERYKSEFIISLNNRELAIKPEIVQFSHFLLNEAGCQKQTTEVITLDELFAPIQPISWQELEKIFSLVETIYLTLTPRTDGGYVAQQVQAIVDKAFEDYDNASLGKACKAVHLLDIPFLLNACAYTIMARPGVIDIIVCLETMDDLYIPADYDAIERILFERGFGLFPQLRILKLLKRHFLMKKNDIEELNITDYIHLHGEPLINRGMLSLDQKNLTSLEGIDQLSDNFNTLDLSFNKIEHLPAGVFEKLSSLNMLRLCSNKNLKEIDPDVFIGLRNLRVLDFAYCGLSTLPATVFNHLTSLTELDLSGNQLTSLDPLIFSNLSNLKILDLRNNNLEMLSPTIFSKNPLLNELYLGNNRLTSLEPALLFQSTRRLAIFSLGHLHPFCTDHSICCHLMECCHDYECCDKEPFDVSEVKSNRIDIVPQQLFDNFYHLEEVDLNSLGLTHLDQNTFCNLTSLKSLNLSNNKLKMLPENIFKDLRNLEVLDLRYNELLYLDAHIFDSLHKLRELRLCHNAFSHMPTEVFHALQNLEFITIEHNKIREYDKAMFSGLTQLKKALL